MTGGVNMLITKIKDIDGFHPSEFQNDRAVCWLDGYIEVPTNLENTFIISKGYCDLVIEGGVLTNVVPRPDYEPIIEPTALTREDEIDAMLIDQECRLTLLELGVNE